MVDTIDFFRATNKFIYDILNDGLNNSYMEMLIAEFSTDTTTILSYILDKWFDSRFEMIDDIDWYNYEHMFIQLYELLKLYVSTDLRLQNELLKELNGKATTSNLILKISIISVILVKINKTDEMSKEFVTRVLGLIDISKIDEIFSIVFIGGGEDAN